MTVNLIATGKPCEICSIKAVNSAVESALTAPRPPHVAGAHLEPGPPEYMQTKKGTTVEVQTGSGALFSAADNAIFKVERDDKTLGVFCSKCLRAACAAAKDTDRIGAEVIIEMRTLGATPQS